MKKQKNIPELRFPEFDTGWNTKTIKTLTSLLKNGSHGTNKEYGNSK